MRTPLRRLGLDRTQSQPLKGDQTSYKVGAMISEFQLLHSIAIFERLNLLLKGNLLPPTMPIRNGEQRVRMKEG